MTNPYFPIHSSLLSSRALCNLVVSQYALDSAATCVFLRYGVNHTYLVRTPSSAYCLRVYVHGLRQQHEIQAEVDLLCHLHAHGLPVSWPIPTRSGSYILSLPAYEGTRYAILFTAAEGKHVLVNDRLSVLYGQLAGRMHVVMDQISTTYQRFHIDLTYLVDNSLRWLATFLEHRQQDYDYLYGVGEQLKARVKDLLPTQCPEYGLCHGDLHMGNIYFQDDNTPTLFDFDGFGYGWRAYDLVIFPWSIIEFDNWSRRAKAKRKRLWNRFLKGYEQHRQLTDAEHEAVKVFAPIRHIWIMAVQIEGAERLGRAGLTDGYFDRGIRFIREWIKYYSVL